MEYEIEFLAVGDASRAGDAITVRYKDGDIYRVIVIDGGTDASGEALVAHIQRHYGEETIIDDVVSTHPDTDHSCGLRAILKAFPVRRLWIHRLWEHSAEIKPLFADKRWTTDGLAKKIKDEYSVVAELISLAEEQRTQILEPFAGVKIGPFTVISPNKATYQHLIPQFRKTPEADIEALKVKKIWLNSPKGMVRKLLERAAAKITEYMAETWGGEGLRDGGITAAENESSTVLLGQFDGNAILLTGDAGINALTWALNSAKRLGLPDTGFSLVQVPHHGSRSNVSPAILDRLLGRPVAEGTSERGKAIASVPADDTQHPRRIVLNAFTRRGYGVRLTQGKPYRLHSGMPARKNTTPAKPVGFYSSVEKYD